MASLTLGDSEGQGSPACCSPWGHKESDTTEGQNKRRVTKWVVIYHNSRRKPVYAWREIREQFLGADFLKCGPHSNEAGHRARKQGTRQSNCDLMLEHGPPLTEWEMDRVWKTEGRGSEARPYLLGWIDVSRSICIYFPAHYVEKSNFFGFNRTFQKLCIHVLSKVLQSRQYAQAPLQWWWWIKGKWKWKSLSCVRLFVIPWTMQSMEFSRPEYWSG